MDRIIVYPAQIPLVEDTLRGQRNTYVSIGRLAAMLYGASVTAVSGFECTPSTGLAVSIAPGSVLEPSTVDDSAYGVITEDVSALTRQYISQQTVSLTIPAAGATYYVYLRPATMDGEATVLPFYNAANPSQTFAGQSNDGADLPTTRANSVTVDIGTAVPSGSIGLWEIIVPSGATSIASSDISQVGTAPVYPTIPELVSLDKADARYIVSEADTTNTRIATAGVSATNGQPWVYSGKTFYNLVFSASGGSNQPKSIGVNDSDGDDIFPWLVAYNGAFYNLATREWTDEGLSHKVNTSGETDLTGDFRTKGSFICGYGAGFGGSTTTGALRWTNSPLVFGNPTGAASVTFGGALLVSDIIGDPTADSSGVNLRGYDYQGTLYNWFFAWNGNITTPKGKVAFQSDLPFGAGVHCQVFIVTIPSGSVTGYNSSGYIASIPTAFANFMYALGCDTNGGVYTVACSPSGNGAVKIYAQSPQNTAGNQTGGLALTIFAYGTYSS